MNQVLKDSRGNKIAEIETRNGKQVIRDSRGYKLGEFDGKVTRDEKGYKVGEGNLLTMLVRKY